MTADSDKSAALDRPVEELEVSVRTAGCLQDLEIRYVGELVQKSETELLGAKNFTPMCLREVRELLGEMGLEVGMKLAEIDDWSPPE